MMLICLMEHLPLYIPAVFIVTTLLAVLIFYLATRRSNIVLATIIIWLAVQSAIALTGFYTETRTLPPRFLLIVLPPVILIITLFLSRKGRAFIDRLDAGKLVLLHTVRIPVELVLYWLFLHKAVPEIITFEGRNLDILAGLTAPLVYYFGFVRRKIGKTALIAWNIICLGLLANVVTHAVLSVATPFQKFAFDQPNVAVLHFPYVWLPACVVQLVLFSHLAVLRHLVREKPDVKFKT
jgi:hypothetical protein